MDSWAAPWTDRKTYRQVSMSAYIKPPLTKNEPKLEYRANFTATERPVKVGIVKKDQKRSAKFESVLEMFRKIEGKEEKRKENLPKNGKKEENLEERRKEIPESVKTPRKYLVKPKDASSVSENCRGFTGSGLGNKLSGQKIRKKRRNSAAKSKPFERGKSKPLEYGNLRKITTFFEPNKFQKISWVGEKTYEHTAQLNFKDGAKCGNITEIGPEELGSHSTNYNHTVGRDLQTGTPDNTGDYGVGPVIETEGDRLK